MGQTRLPHENPPEEASRFAQLGLSPIMLAALRHAAYDQPTPVQEGVIPLALAGRDIMAQARTGTGKTASFVIPILERLTDSQTSQPPQALILAPTRELAVQVHDEAVKLAHGRRVRCVAIYGGKPIRGQLEKLKRGAHIVVGTPGRVLDHISRQSLNLSALKCIVLDEVDRMLDIGFRPDIERILRKCPAERQTMLLSATVPPPIQRLAHRYMQQPEELDFSSTDIAVETIEQFYFTVEKTEKFDLLVKLLRRENPAQAIIFCRTKRGTEKIFQRLRKRFDDVGCMHGDMNQDARSKMMDRFRKQQVRCLAATDVVGRGIDVTGISHIINYDIPQFSDDYVHRVGRTGRMGREGVAFTFVTPEEGNELTRIEMRIDRLLQRDSIDGMGIPKLPVTPLSRAAHVGADATSELSAAGPAPAEVEPPREPLYGRGGRPRRKHRRAL